MADSHGPAPDPNAAPMHHEIKEQFSPVEVAICVVLGLAALVAGIVTGIIFVNN